MPFRTARTKIWQYDILVRGRRFRGSCGTDDYETAKAIEAQVRSETKKHDGGYFTLSEACGTYYHDVARHQASEATTRSQMKAILAGLGKTTPIHKLTDADIAQWIGKQRATVANATVNRRLQTLGRALRHMSVYKAALPELDLKRAQTKEPKERIRELSVAEQTRLFEHLPEDLRPSVTFCLMTGARISTMAGLLWDDVREEEGEIIFRLKGSSEMRFPLSAELRALLSALPRSNSLHDRRYVFTRLDKEMVERVAIVPRGGVYNAEFPAAVKAAEIPDFRFHDLRHTFGTRMLRQTQNLKLVSRLMGHADVSTTARYAHVLMDDMQRAMAEFSAFSGGESQAFPQSHPSNPNKI